MKSFQLTADIQHASEVVVGAFHLVFVFLLERNPIELVARLVDLLLDERFVDTRRRRFQERQIRAGTANEAFDGVR